MDPMDAELYRTLREQLAEAGEVTEGAGYLSLRGFPEQRVTPVRLHITPASLGRACRELGPDYADQFPLMEPVEAALVAVFIHVLAEVELAKPDAPDLTLASLT